MKPIYAIVLAVMLTSCKKEPEKKPVSGWTEEEEKKSLEIDRWVVEKQASLKAEIAQLEREIADDRAKELVDAIREADEKTAAREAEAKELREQEAAGERIEAAYRLHKEDEARRREEERHEELLQAVKGRRRW